MKLSVALAVYNEEKFLGDCLEAVKNLADEVVIVDGSSTDKTVDVAKKFGAKIKICDNPKNFHINKKKAIDMCSSEWILQLDADEIVSRKLAVEIEKIINSNSLENGYWIPRRNYFLGKFLNKGGVYPDYTLRLYRNGFGQLDAKSVHEQATVKGGVGYLKEDLLHYSNRNFSDYINKRFLRYSSIMADEITGGFLSNFFIKPIFDKNQGFFSIYFRNLGFLDGFAGFVWALFSSLHFPMAYIIKNERKYARSNS